MYTCSSLCFYVAAAVVCVCVLEVLRGWDICAPGESVGVLIQAPGGTIHAKAQEV